MSRTKNSFENNFGGMFCTFVLSSNRFFCSAMSMTPFRALATSGQSVECWKYIEPAAGGTGGGGDPMNVDFRFSVPENGRER